VNSNRVSGLKQHSCRTTIFWSVVLGSADEADKKGSSEKDPVA
jgi:hypothetical protein